MASKPAGAEQAVVERIVGQLHERARRRQRFQCCAAAPASYWGNTTHAGRARSCARATLSAGAFSSPMVPFTVSCTRRLNTAPGT